MHQNPALDGIRQIVNSKMSPITVDQSQEPIPFLATEELQNVDKFFFENEFKTHYVRNSDIKLFLFLTK
jgi:hypothetical protein